MISVTVAQSDADLDRWRQVRMAVVPGERVSTVAELRAGTTPGRLLVLAEDGGQLVGSGIADHSDLPGGFVCPRVLPGARRRGAWHGHLAGPGEALRSPGPRQSRVGGGRRGFGGLAQQFGFAEVDRQVEQLYAVGAEPEPTVPAGICIVSVADRPELGEQAYHRVHETIADLALTAVLQVSLQEWHRDWIGTPEAAFVALADDGQVVAWPPR